MVLTTVLSLTMAHAISRVRPGCEMRVWSSAESASFIRTSLLVFPPTTSSSK